MTTGKALIRNAHAQFDDGDALPVATFRIRRNAMKGCFLIAFVSVLMCAHGDVNGWKNAVGSGLWSGADNWWEGHVPTAGETLYVTNATPDGLTVTLDEDFVILITFCANSNIVNSPGFPIFTGPRKLSIFIIRVMPSIKSST